MNQWKPAPQAQKEIEAGYPMIAALLVSSASFLVLRWYLGRKGEL